MRARVRCFFSEPIGSPLENRNCVRKSTEIQGEWHGIRDGCAIHRQPKSNRKSLLIVKWKISPAKQDNCLTKKSSFFPPPPFFHDLNTSAKEPIPVRWYSRLQHPNCFDYEQYVSRCFSGVQCESLSARMNRFQADHLCLSSRLRRGGKQNYWGAQMNTRENGPALTSDTVCGFCICWMRLKYT